MPSDFSGYEPPKPTDLYNQRFDPYGNQPQRPHSSSKSIWIILAVIGGVMLLGCCGGCLGLVYFGKGVIEEEVANELRGNPVLIREVGTIESLKVNFVASAAQDDEEIFVYDVQGSKSSGKIKVLSVTDDLFDEEIVIWAELELPDGKKFTLIDER